MNRRSAARFPGIPPYGHGGGFVVNVEPGAHSDNNVFRSNIANYNDWWGFYIGGAGGDTIVTGTVFERDVANSNGSFGFGAWSANEDTWTRNIANANGGTGFALWNPCSGNTLSGNVGRTNAEYDAYDGNDPINNWTNNIFGTTSPAGIS